MEETMKIGRLVLLALIITGLTACKSLPVFSSPDRALIEQAEAGDIDAQFRLASAYDTGAGFLGNGNNAKKWYLKAANAGHVEAQNSIGSIYQAEKRYTEAMSWYQKAADQKHALAINNMAYLYDLGLGVPQDRQKGHDLYMQSASLGWAEAMFNLANMYGAGQLGEVDYHKAYVWCSRSKKYAEPGSYTVQERSSQCLEYLKDKLPPEKIAQAKIEASNWAPNK